MISYLVSTNENLCAKFSTLMQYRYEIRMIVRVKFLSRSSSKENLKMKFSSMQSKYVRDLLKKFDLQECTTAKTPMATDHQTRL